jgi:hypothetical protein
MSSLEIFAMIVLPVSIVALSIVALFVQLLAERKVQKHVDELTKLRAESELAEIRAKGEGAPFPKIGRITYYVDPSYVGRAQDQLSFGFISGSTMRRSSKAKASQADFQLASEFPAMPSPSLPAV